MKKIIYILVVFLLVNTIAFANPQIAGVMNNLKKYNVKAGIVNGIDIKKLSSDLSTELEQDEKELLGDLMMLWSAAVENSDSIKFAIYKLSNSDEEVDRKSMLKKVLSPIAGVMPIIGYQTANPLIATSTIMGGGVLDASLSDDKEAYKRFNRVTDADLVILTREIDDLQEELLEFYYNYVSAIEDLHYVDRMTENRYKHYQKAKKMSSDAETLANVFYKKAVDEQYQARQKLLSTRIMLEQLVGADALKAVDERLKERVAVK